MRSLARIALVASLLAAGIGLAAGTTAAQDGDAEASVSHTCMQLQCNFEVEEAPDSIEGNITRVEWTFGPDGENETGNPVEHRFPEPGTYDVTVVVEGEGGENATRATTTSEVTVSEAEVPWTAVWAGVLAFVGSIVLARMT